MNIEVNSNVSVQPAATLAHVFQYAGVIANVEGKNTGKHAARLTTAVGDLSASLLGEEGSLIDETLHEEVAQVILRSVILGMSRGLNLPKLQEAIGRETEYIVQRGIDARIAGTMKDAGFGQPTDVLSQIFGGCVPCSGKDQG